MISQEKNIWIRILVFTYCLFVMNFVSGERIVTAMGMGSQPTTAQEESTLKENPAETPAAQAANKQSNPSNKVNKDSDIPDGWKPISMEATAYTQYDDGCSAYTYRGNPLKRGVVAVDPRVIPLGTKLYIPGYGYAIADDIGGAIKGHKIDLSMDTQDEAFAFGRKVLTIYIIDSPV